MCSVLLNDAIFFKKVKQCWKKDYILFGKINVHIFTANFFFSFFAFLFFGTGKKAFWKLTVSITLFTLFSYFSGSQLPCEVTRNETIFQVWNDFFLSFMTKAHQREMDHTSLRSHNKKNSNNRKTKRRDERSAEKNKRELSEPFQL